MYISKLSIEGYKNCKNKSIITFNQGLNILVGENASGKTTIIDAIRVILKDRELPYISEDDFYRAFGKAEAKNDIRIDIKMEDLSSNEEITFLSWCNANFEAELHLEVEKNPNNKGYYKKAVWGGKSRASAFEEETFDYIDTIYLPALRNAEEKLTNGKKSRLALLLQHQYNGEESKEQLVNAFSTFNSSIIENKEHNFDEIEKAKTDINSAMLKSMGSVFGQSINLQFSENSFLSILQNIKMVFFPYIGEMDITKFRDVAINSLGYNNLLYMATVFAELEVITKDKNLLTVLLIEEPEAHLHPQLQVKLIKYLQKISVEKDNLQIILTTHSPVLASSVPIDNLIYISRGEDNIYSCRISSFTIEDGSKQYLNRWLDVTKSTILFSKGIILVEGICETMLLPVFAPLVLKEYNRNEKSKKKLPESLEEAGVTVININGINFKYFFPLFCNLEGLDSERIPIRCSGITDKDPRAIEKKLTETTEQGTKERVVKEEIYPLPKEKIEGGNEAIDLVESVNVSKYARLYIAALKTFEYDMVIEGNIKIMAEVIEDGWAKEGKVKQTCKQMKEKDYKEAGDEERRNAGKYIYEHIDSNELGKAKFAQLLAKKIEQGERFAVPQYIKSAIIWACGGENAE
ncbi:ATP-dependent nuclease [Lacrimispora sp.]|uniref:ATP-dependent nuclease n=1 Tax=Lacrimispora sp. TaxID=2719234 RepID=UPI00289C82EE|nr:AAA family ATPase [Lacrimispora sp.]